MVDYVFTVIGYCFTSYILAAVCIEFIGLVYPMLESEH